MTAAKFQTSAAVLYMCCTHGQPVCQLTQTLQVAGNTEQATSKAIAAFATAVQATQLLVTRLDDDKATTNSIVRYVWHDFAMTAARDVAHPCTQQCTVLCSTLLNACRSVPCCRCIESTRDHACMY